MQRRLPERALVHLPVHASWLNQVEIYFSVLQRKLITPDDFADLDDLADRLLAFEDRYNQAATPSTGPSATATSACSTGSAPPSRAQTSRPPHDPRRTNELDH